MTRRAGVLQGSSVHTGVMATRGTVRLWREEEGWGVVDSPETPGGCWTHFSHLRMPGDRALQAGAAVELEWEAPGQDGYPCRAVRAWPAGQAPSPEPAAVTEPSAAYRSTLTLVRDEDPDAAG